MAPLAKAAPGEAAKDQGPGSGPVAAPKLTMPVMSSPKLKVEGQPLIAPVFVPPPKVEKKLEPEPEPEKPKEPPKPKPPPQSLEDIYGPMPVGVTPMTAEEAVELDSEIQALSKKRRFLLIPALIVPSVIFFFVGYSVGKTFYERVLYNKKIEDGKRLKEEIDKVAKGVDEINNLLANAQPNKVSWDLVDALAKTRKKLDSGVLATTNYKGFSQTTVDRLMNFYLDTSTLFAKAVLHARKSLNDKKALEDAMLLAGKQQQEFAAIVEATDEKSIGRLVRLKETVKKAGKITGFKIQAGPGAPEVELSPERVVVMDPGSMQALTLPSEMKDYALRVFELMELSKKVKGYMGELVSGLDEIAKLETIFVF